MYEYLLVSLPDNAPLPLLRDKLRPPMVNPDEKKFLDSLTQNGWVPMFAVGDRILFRREKR